MRLVMQEPRVLGQESAGEVVVRMEERTWQLPPKHGAPGPAEESGSALLRPGPKLMTKVLKMSWQQGSREETESLEAPVRPRHTPDQVLADGAVHPAPWLPAGVPNSTGGFGLFHLASRTGPLVVQCSHGTCTQRSQSDPALRSISHDTKVASLLISTSRFWECEHIAVHRDACLTCVVPADLQQWYGHA